MTGRAIIDRHELLAGFLRFFAIEEDALSPNLEDRQHHICRPTRHALTGPSARPPAPASPT